ncbi:MAG: exo-beta-N-acetylmuramidase NamZ family protein [Bacteroidota bacterium]
MCRILLAFLSILIFNGLTFCQQKKQTEIKPGAERTEVYLPSLEGKSLGVVANHTSLVDSVHLVDTLISKGMNVKKIFSPEHGFRGDRDAGEYVSTYKDDKTGLSVISLYGKSKKPKPEDLNDLDVVIFDIQDAGVRFYTYISTLHYVMEACAKTETKLIIFDRPNPNGFYIDGPVLKKERQSFVGKHPIPIVHGMTIAELARMINEEGWLKDSMKCELDWVKCSNYTHDSLYELPVKPSPNLPNMRSVYLYPSLGLFEGTIMNVGRGTDFPFQVYGHPDLNEGSFSYEPRPIEGASKAPKHEGEVCHGVDLRKISVDSVLDNPGINLQWIKNAYNNTDIKDNFFLPFFNNLAGDSRLQKMLERETPVSEIKKSWQKELNQFARKREKYLLYKDFTE